MRLAKLTLQGFKSFADRTEFTFDRAITGVVGPNGCGKSNVVDAIKWVLGERSSKALRGTEMLDVIFAGSAGRKPMGMASVTLTFENPVEEGGPFSALTAAEVAEKAVEGEEDQSSKFKVQIRKVKVQPRRRFRLLLLRLLHRLPTGTRSASTAPSAAGAGCPSTPALSRSSVGCIATAPAST